ncbi:kinase-like domain-containing protein [Abortiporus biennis]|nr:kinase-like domain-containing protein [Abortiporus biennis]
MELIRVVGHGGWGTVYYGHSLLNAGTYYAVKVMPLGKAHSGVRRMQYKELCSLRKVSKHPNITKFELSFTDKEEKYFFLCMKYCEGGSLVDAIRHPRRPFARNDALVKKLFLQLLDAVEHCHKLGVYHRDLKPDNILLDKTWSNLYLSDFGLASETKKNTGFTTGTRNYSSPECINHDKKLTTYDAEKTDIWALGMILITMLTGHSLWKEATIEDRNFRKFMEDDDFFKKNCPISEETVNICRRVFTYDNASSRIDIPTFREMIKNVKTFYMSEEDIAQSTSQVKEIAQKFLTKPMSEEQARAHQAVREWQKALAETYDSEDSNSSNELHSECSTCLSEMMGRIASKTIPLPQLTDDRESSDQASDSIGRMDTPVSSGVMSEGGGLFASKTFNRSPLGLVWKSVMDTFEGVSIV